MWRQRLAYRPFCRQSLEMLWVASNEDALTPQRRKSRCRRIAAIRLRNHARPNEWLARRHDNEGVFNVRLKARSFFPAGLLFFAKFNCEGNDGLTKGGILDADESSMETKSLIGQSEIGPLK